MGNLKEMVSGTQAWFEQEKNITDNVFEDKKKPLFIIERC